MSNADELWEAAKHLRGMTDGVHLDAGQTALLSAVLFDEAWSVRELPDEFQGNDWAALVFARGINKRTT
jgi:hypothetical protein